MPNAANEKDKRPTDLYIPYTALTTFEQIAMQQHECELPSMLEDLSCNHVKFELTCDQCTRFLMAGMAPLDVHVPGAEEAAARSAIDDIAAQQSKHELDDMLEDNSSDQSANGTPRNLGVMLSTASIAAHDEHDADLVQLAAPPTMSSATSCGGAFFGVTDVDFSRRVPHHTEHKCFGCTTHKLFQRVLAGL